MKKIFYLSLLSLFVLLQSCVITENIHFNKDFSGNLRYDIDMSQFIAFSKMMAENADELDSTAGAEMEDIPSADQIVDSIKAEGQFAELENMDGVSNFSVNSDGEVMIIELDFSDVEALNRAYSYLKNSNAMGGGEMVGEIQEQTYFTLNKKTFTYEIYKNPEEQAQFGDEGEEEQLGELITFETNLSFDKTIKSLDAEGVDVNQDGNKVNFSYDLEKLVDDSPNPKIVIKLK